MLCLFLGDDILQDDIAVRHKLVPPVPKGLRKVKLRLGIVTAHVVEWTGVARLEVILGFLYFRVCVIRGMQETEAPVVNGRLMDQIRDTAVCCLSSNASALAVLGWKRRRDASPL